MYRKKLDKMDLDKMLRHVSNLNDYISVTQEVSNHASTSSKVQFNMSTVLLLKKLRSLEIEYFNKCEGNGAALALFERMVEQPSSKTWGLLGKELVALLQYWLDAIRKHLIIHNQHWWTFLKLLLKFIKCMRSKDRALPDILVEGTAECLLDLATSSQPDILQRYEILCCLNVCCAESSREIRFALKDKFENYFGKLAGLVRGCGYLPAQCSGLETLMRWLLPRHDAAVRAAAARRWFPEAACGRKALQLFLERPWQDFFLDARDFLNACNEISDLVTSVVCRKVTIGAVVVVTGTEKRATWLDVNSSNRSVSIVLDPRLLDALQVQDVTSWETLTIMEEVVTSAQLYRESCEATLVVRTSFAPRLRPSGVEVSGCVVKAVLSTSADLRTLDDALRSVFSQKYQVSLDLDKPTTLSPQDYRENSKRMQNSLEEDTRFSHPVEVQRRKHSGFIVRTRNPVSWKSPSTASTTSLAQLHEKLASLPQYNFDKEAVHVCALPELSTVTEISEDDRQSILSSQTLKHTRPVGIGQITFKTSDRHSQSDGEVNKKSNFGRYLSPIEKDDEHSTNCLLVATIGSADESVINDTLERLTKNKDYRSDNIVNLLVQEALQKDLNNRELLDSGINTGENSKKTQNINDINSEAIENTPLEKQNVNAVVTNKEKERICTVISNTTTDESNDVVCETPRNFVTVRRRNAKVKVTKEKKNVEEINEGNIFDENAVEEFFSQHISENQRGEIVISPTLARKINETSSESEPFEDCLLMQDGHNSYVENIELQDLEIVECLNSIVDRVCSDLKKYTELLNQEVKEIEMIADANNEPINNPPDIVPLTDISHVENIGSQQQQTQESTQNKKKRSIKLKYTVKKTAKTTKSRANAKKKNKLASPIMSPLRETNDIDDVQNKVKTPEAKNKQSPKTNSPSIKSSENTPLIRRKRKLYSPKYENIDSEKTSQLDDENKDFKVSKMHTPKYNATCYKDIEMDRKNKIRQPRVRKSRAKSDTLSPRTKRKNDMFDQLKETIECPDAIVMADKKTEKDMAIYNFTSDSEDEDFKKKKIEVQKRISSTTIASGDSAMSTRHGRSVNRINYSETKSSDETVENSSTKKKRTVRRKRTPRTRIAKPVMNDLIDERMRKADPDKLNTSVIVEKPDEEVSEEPKLKLAAKPEMELIPDEIIIEVIDTKKPKTSKKRHKKAEALSLKKDKMVNSNTFNKELDNDDRTTSPLPGLVIEAMPETAVDANDSVSINMLQKLKKMQQDCFDECVNETNTTQNLLSDVERVNYSPVQMNLTEEFKKFDNHDSKLGDENTKISSKSSNTKIQEPNIDSKTILRVKKEVSDKTKRKLRSNSPEVINLSDAKSEKSIATVGKSPITAHGDFNEAPPDSELLTEKFRPRDLEVEYLSQSMKEYYTNLRNVVNDSQTDQRRKSNDTASTKIVPIARESNDKSPIVSVNRLSFDDISKWLPSPRRSDTDSNCSVDYIKDRKSTKTSTPNKVKQTKKIYEQDLNTGSVQKIDEISLDSGNVLLRRSTRTKAVVHNHNENDSPKKDQVKPNYSPIHSKWLRLHGGKACPDNDSDKYKDNVHENAIKNFTSPQTSNANVKKIKKTYQFDNKQANIQSMISPIKLFDEVCTSEKPGSPILRPKSSITRQSSSIDRHDSSYVRQHTRNTKLESVFERHESTNSKQEGSSYKEYESNSKKKKDWERSIRNIDSSPVTKRISTRIEQNVSRIKRKSDSPERGYPKRKRLEDNVTMSESGPSTSSVNEWFRRNVPVSKDESIDTSLRDCVQNVMEKLDTTLAEIHQNTTKKFIHMFVDAQGRLPLIRSEQRSMLKTVASEILATVVNVIDQKFADLDRRSQEMHDQFASQLKAQAQELIREDCRRKAVMVSLLREDLNAMLARIKEKDSS